MSQWRLPNLHGFGFTLSVALAVAFAMFWPGLFNRWGGFETKVLIVPLIQLIMFGMGTTLSVADFTRVLKLPWPVFVGLVLQFGIMPFVGWVLATAFGFPPLVAAGVVLVGSCPGGVASNVITFLAGGNVALSVTMTACSTLLSPLMTPLMMKVLAGQFVPVDFRELMVSILNMIVAPIALGLIVNRVLHGRASRSSSPSSRRSPATSSSRWRPLSSSPWPSTTAWATCSGTQARDSLA
jgi:BASS family bile acid:Na+ symporter